MVHRDYIISRSYSLNLWSLPDGCHWVGNNWLPKQVQDTNPILNPSQRAASAACWAMSSAVGKLILVDYSVKSMHWSSPSLIRNKSGGKEGKGRERKGREGRSRYQPWHAFQLRTEIMMSGLKDSCVLRIRRSGERYSMRRGTELL